MDNSQHTVVQPTVDAALNERATPKIKDEAYWRKHFENQKRAQRKWRSENATKVEAYQKKWRAANADKMRSTRRAYNKRRWQMIKKIKAQIAEKDARQDS